MGFFHKLFHPGKVNCNEVQKLSSDFLEKDFAPPKRPAFQAHLDNCGPCRAFVDTLASTIGILSRFPKMTSPPTFHDSVMDRTSQETRQFAFLLEAVGRGKAGAKAGEEVRWVS